MTDTIMTPTTAPTTSGAQSTETDTGGGRSGTGSNRGARRPTTTGPATRPALTATSRTAPISIAEIVAARHAGSPIDRVSTPAKALFRRLADRNSANATPAAAAAVTPITPRYANADLDDTITRLIAFREAGADVLYAPGIRTPADISAIVGAVGAPVNVLAIPGTPSIPELAGLGVARVSTGSLLAWAAYGALADATREIFGPGTHTYAARLLDGSLADAAFGSSE